MEQLVCQQFTAFYLSLNNTLEIPTPECAVEAFLAVATLNSLDR